MGETDGKVPIENMLAGLGPALFSSIRAPFGIFDSDFRIVWINKSMATIHKCDPEKVVGEFCYEALRGCEPGCKACPLEEAITGGRTQVEEMSLDFPKGVRRWGEVHAYPVRGNDKKVSAVIVIVFETTASKSALQKQKAYTLLLEQRLSRENNPKKIEAHNEQTAITVKLSRREVDVLRLITEGFTNAQISELLDISAHTVKTHVNGVFNKLGVNDRTQAAVLATRNHLI
jgi:DNA-binding CsgD family transcriptional regulator